MVKIVLDSYGYTKSFLTFNVKFYMHISPIFTNRVTYCELYLIIRLHCVVHITHSTHVGHDAFTHKYLP